MHIVRQSIIIIMKKTCTKCKQDKDFAEFAVRKDTKDGLRSMCKCCCLIKRNKWIKENQSKVSDYGKKSYQKNKEKRDKYREVNKEKLKLRMKKYNDKAEIKDKKKNQKHAYYENNKEKTANDMKKYRVANRGRISEQNKSRYHYQKEMREMQEDAGFEQC